MMGPVGQSRNLTVRLDPETIRKAKILAARRGSSVSALVRELVEDLVREDEAYETARRRALARMEEGLPLGGGPYGSRDELHER